VQVRAARTIEPDFARYLDDVTFQELSRVSGLPRTEVEKRVAAFRKAIEPSFQRRAPFPPGDLSNERCFDAYEYASFRVSGAGARTYMRSRGGAQVRGRMHLYVDVQGE
jgi:hypothetical protein